MIVQNADRLIRRLSTLSLEARRGIGKELARAVVQLDAYGKQKIQGGSRGGRVYRRRSVTHQASAPGEFPKTDTGQLVGSLFFRVASDKLSAVWGTALAYGRYLEFGTSTMLSRPWLRPTFAANRADIEAGVNGAVREAIRQAVRRG